MDKYEIGLKILNNLDQMYYHILTSANKFKWPNKDGVWSALAIKLYSKEISNGIIFQPHDYVLLL